MAFPILGLLPFAEKVLDAIFPDPKTASEAKIKLLELQQSGELAILAAETDLAKGQQEINKVEAASGDRFASRWRPFIGWVCGVAFAYHFVLQPLLAFALSTAGYNVTLPAFDMEALNTVLLGMLGLGGMRSFERVKGVTR
jgi:hypothetical protein